MMKMNMNGKIQIKKKKMNNQKLNIRKKLSNTGPGVLLKKTSHGHLVFRVNICEDLIYVDS